jgi:uncharacterized membrane protein YeaQ/YmgE (transglycosylase-associated protein family)
MGGRSRSARSEEGIPMLTRRRLYFLLPDTDSARGMLNEMLLARIDERRIRFLARRGTLPADLPEATVLQKTDIVHGAKLGVVIGGVAGTVAGLLAVMFPPAGVPLQLVTVLIAALVGALLGAWIASMAASAVPNTQLARFQADIERGKVLMMVDVPLSRIAEIMQIVARRHPEAVAGGFEPTVVFP